MTGGAAISPSSVPSAGASLASAVLASSSLPEASAAYCVQDTVTRMGMNRSVRVHTLDMPVSLSSKYEGMHGLHASKKSEQLRG